MPVDEGAKIHATIKGSVWSKLLGNGDMFKCFGFLCKSNGRLVVNV